MRSLRGHGARAVYLLAALAFLALTLIDPDRTFGDLVERLTVVSP